MSHIFAAPKPVIVQPPPPPPPALAAVATPTPAAAAEQSRVQAQNAVTRGLAGTVATSPVGVLTEVPASLALTRKTLLGE